jgi:hypothetical protein
MSEEYKVRFWIVNDKGFNEQQSKSYWFNNKNSHKKAINECVKEHQLQGKKIKVVNCTYQ